MQKWKLIHKKLEDPITTSVLFIDPGPIISGWVLMENKNIINAGNNSINEIIYHVGNVDDLVIEMIQPYTNNSSLSWTMFSAGMLAGKLQHKRLIQAYRTRIKGYFNIPRGKNADSFIRQRCIDTYGKRKDVTKHAWQALGISIPYYDKELYTVCM